MSRELIFPAKAEARIREDTYQDLVEIAKTDGHPFHVLVRIALEEWVKMRKTAQATQAEPSQ